MSKVQQYLADLAEHHLSRLAQIFRSDVMATYGPMDHILPQFVRTEVESLSRKGSVNKNLTVLLDTGGGLIDAVERTVDVIRHHYNIVNFVIPDQAMSAGTIFALSGDQYTYGLFWEL